MVFRPFPESYAMYGIERCGIRVPRMTNYWLVKFIPYSEVVTKWRRVTPAHQKGMMQSNERVWLLADRFERISLLVDFLL